MFVTYSMLVIVLRSTGVVDSSRTQLLSDPPFGHIHLRGHARHDVQCIFVATHVLLEELTIQRLMATLDNVSMQAARRTIMEYSALTLHSRNQAESHLLIEPATWPRGIGWQLVTVPSSSPYSSRGAAIGQPPTPSTSFVRIANSGLLLSQIMTAALQSSGQAEKRPSTKHEKSTPP